MPLPCVSIATKVPLIAPAIKAAYGSAIPWLEIYRSSQRSIPSYSSVRSFFIAKRHVLAWRRSNTVDAGFCVEVPAGALARYCRPEIFNADQSLPPRRRGQLHHQL